MLNKTLILWDWDNTLIDTFEAIYAAQNDTRVRYGLPKWTREESKNAMNASGRNLFRDVFGADKAAQARACFLSCYERHTAEIQLKEGATDILAFTKAKGFINVLASNKAGPILRNEAQTLGVFTYFARVIGAEDTNSDKPSKNFTDAATDGFMFDDIISIGDGKSDIQMAHNYDGGIGILVWTNPNSAEFDRIKPDYSFASLEDVLNFLETTL